jgi:hypothetical protein
MCFIILSLILRQTISLSPAKSILIMIQFFKKKLPSFKKTFWMKYSVSCWFPKLLHIGIPLYVYIIPVLWRDCCHGQWPGPARLFEWLRDWHGRRLWNLSYFNSHSAALESALGCQATAGEFLCPKLLYRTHTITMCICSSWFIILAKDDFNKLLLLPVFQDVLEGNLTKISIILGHIIKMLFI